MNQKTEVIILKKRECQTGQIGTLIDPVNHQLKLLIGVFIIKDLTEIIMSLTGIQEAQKLAEL